MTEKYYSKSHPNTLSRSRRNREPDNRVAREGGLLNTSKEVIQLMKVKGASIRSMSLHTKRIGHRKIRISEHYSLTSTQWLDVARPTSKYFSWAIEIYQEGDQTDVLLVLLVKAK